MMMKMLSSLNVIVNNYGIHAIRDFILHICTRVGNLVLKQGNTLYKALQN